MGGELSYLKTKPDVAATVLRFDVYGQYVDTTTGLGGYAQLPLAYANGNNTSATGIGGAELGGIYTTRLGDDVRLVLHAGSCCRPHRPTRTTRTSCRSSPG